MPVIRFVREGRDVECYPGENLREVALREGIEIYGLKGKLGNCGGCGQCITCYVDVLEEDTGTTLSDRTAVEIQKLRSRPKTWRLACQTLVQRSLLVLTRPQSRLPDAETRLADARDRELPAGPLSWPEPADREEEPRQENESSPERVGRAVQPPSGQAAEGTPTTTSDEGSTGPLEPR